MARLRRRSRYTWFPTQSRLLQDLPTTFRSSGLIVDNDGSHSVGILPLTYDFPQQSTVADPATVSLADFKGSAYILKRIVGKIYVSLLGPSTGISGCFVAAGFFVARADDTNPDLPVAAVTSPNEYDPLNPDNMMEPWIWRRTWLLNNPYYVPDLATFNGQGLFSDNRSYGDVMSGTHVDAQTARRVDEDSRLYMAFSAHNLVAEAADPGNVTINFDLRLLGALRKNKNRSTF